VNPTEFHWKLKLKIPLTIGSIPIMDGPEALLRFNRQQQQHQVVSQNLQISTQQRQRQRDRDLNLERDRDRDRDRDRTSASAHQRRLSNINNNNHGRLVGGLLPTNSNMNMIVNASPTPTSSTPSSTPTTAALRPTGMPAILVTSDSDNPPDYIPMSKTLFAISDEPRTFYVNITITILAKRSFLKNY